MAVPIASEGQDLKAGRAVRLFGGKNSGMRVSHFDPAPGGQRFLGLLVAEEPESQPVHLVLHWEPRAVDSRQQDR